MIFTVLTLKGVCNPSLSIHEWSNSPPVLLSAGVKLIQRLTGFTHCCFWLGQLLPVLVLNMFLLTWTQLTKCMQVLRNVIYPSQEMPITLRRGHPGSFRGRGRLQGKLTSQFQEEKHWLVWKRGQWACRRTVIRKSLGRKTQWVLLCLSWCFSAAVARDSCPRRVRQRRALAGDYLSLLAQENKLTPSLLGNSSSLSSSQRKEFFPVVSNILKDDL